MTNDTEHPAVRVPAGLFIGGEWLERTSAGTMTHVNPATGRIQHEFVVAGPTEIDAAVAAARDGLQTFRSWSAPQRRDVLHRIAALLRERAEEFCIVSTLETGIHQRMTATIAMGAAEWFDYYAGWADKLEGAVHPTPGAFDYSLAEPFGVIAVVVSSNGPTGSIGMKVAPALAAGCTVVLKPPEIAPLSSQLFARLCQDAGLPAGVVNVVPGGVDAGEALVRHPGVDKISFTGGTATAKRIQAACAESLTPLVLELGGKSANLVFDDADLDRVTASATAAILTRCGQSCITPSRLIVHDRVYDELAERVRDRFEATTLGDPFDADVDLGPVSSGSACDRIMAMIDDAKRDRSGQLLAGGGREGGRLADGYFIRPTLFGDVDNSTDLAQHEVFGPVLAMMRFRDEDEAVQLANETAFGLAAYVHTSSLARAHRMAARLDAGNVGINGGLGMAGPYAPFGGFGESGYGKEGGRDGLLEFVRFKNVNIVLDEVGA